MSPPGPVPAHKAQGWRDVGLPEFYAARRPAQATGWWRWVWVLASISHHCDEKPDLSASLLCPFF